MRKITEFDGLVTDRMVEFTDKAPEPLRGKRIPMMCDEQERYKFSDLVDLTNGTTFHRDEKHKVAHSYDTNDFNDLIEMGILREWHPYQTLRLVISTERNEKPYQVDDEMYVIPSAGILSNADGKDIAELTDAELDDLTMDGIRFNPEKVVAWFSEHDAPVTEEALTHNFKAWQEDEKSGFLDKENGYHLFSPCAHNPLQFSRTTLHPSCADWQDTYTWG